MDEIIIFHGSDHIIEEPKYCYGDAHNDYGSAFYCTTDLEMAKEWANRLTSNGYVNKYSLNIKGLKILNLTDKKYSVINWIAILLHYRSISLADRTLYSRRLNFLEKHFYIDVSQYDVVIGYRADDAYFKFPMIFIRNELSIEKMEEIYNLGHLGKQIALISERAFKSIKFIESIDSEPIYQEKYRTRKNQADVRFEEIRIEEVNSDKPKIEDLMKQYD